MGNTFGLDEDDKQEVKIMEISDKKKKRPFAYWNVGDREYKLKLTTEQICKIEEKYRCNLMTLLLQNSGGMPPLGIMLTVIQAALQPWEHGIGYKDVQKAYGKYVDEGGTQLDLLTDVIMQILMVSGFFTEAQSEEIEEKMAEVKDSM